MSWLLAVVGLAVVAVSLVASVPFNAFDEVMSSPALDCSNIRDMRWAERCIDTKDIANLGMGWLTSKYCDIDVEVEDYTICVNELKRLKGG